MIKYTISLNSNDILFARFTGLCLSPLMLQVTSLSFLMRGQQVHLHSLVQWVSIIFLDSILFGGYETEDMVSLYD